MDVRVENMSCSAERRGCELAEGEVEVEGDERCMLK